MHRLTRRKAAVKIVAADGSDIMQNKTTSVQGSGNLCR